MKKNLEYTKLWTEKNFDLNQVKKYDSKWYTKFEKNIKHKQQLYLIKKYLKPDMRWIDAPIGSGRLMDSIDHPIENSFGLDLSDGFIEYNQLKGISCFRCDLFDIKLDKKFDLITGLQTIFAFEEFTKILLNYIKLLDKGGYLITDIVNLHMYDDFSMDKRDDHSIKVNGMKLNDIYRFFESNDCEVCEVINHDFYDSEKMIYWRKSGNLITKKIKGLIWRILDLIYFKLHLFSLFNFFENKNNRSSFSKFLVVVRKN